MTVPDLVEKLKASQNRVDGIARLIGYVAMIQHYGWDKLPVNRVTKFNLQRTFRQIEVDPFKVTF